MHTRRGRGVGVRVGHRRGSIFPLGGLPPPSVRAGREAGSRRERVPAQRKERARVNESGYMRKVKRTGHVCVLRARARARVHIRERTREKEKKRMFALGKGDRGWRQSGEREAESEYNTEREITRERERKILLGAPDIPPFFGIRFRSPSRRARYRRRVSCRIL